MNTNELDEHRKWVRLHESNEYQAEAARRITALLAEVERLRRGRDIWRAERDDLEERLSLLLWELTDCKLSKSGYDVRTMVSEIEATFERYAEMDRAELQAERDRLAATVERVSAITPERIEAGALALYITDPHVGDDPVPWQERGHFIRESYRTQVRAAALAMGLTIEGTGS